MTNDFGGKTVTVMYEKMNEIRYYVVVDGNTNTIFIRTAESRTY